MFWMRGRQIQIYHSQFRCYVLHQTPLCSKTRIMGKNKAKGNTSKGKCEKIGAESSKSERTAGPITCNKSGSVVIKILAKPGAKDNGFTNIDAEGVGVQIAAPATEGEANAELVKFLASSLGVRKSDVTLERGAKSRQKTVAVSGTTVSDVEERLRTLCCR